MNSKLEQACNIARHKARSSWRESLPELSDFDFEVLVANPVLSKCALCLVCLVNREWKSCGTACDWLP